MSADHQSAMIEITRISRVSGQNSTLQLELYSGAERCSADIRRSLNPTLFDFLASHAEDDSLTGVSPVSD